MRKKAKEFTEDDLIFEERMAWIPRLLSLGLIIIFVLGIIKIANASASFSGSGTVLSALKENGLGTVENKKFPKVLYFKEDGNITQNATNLIVKHEGFEATPYQDLGGDMSIGYGQPARNIKSITKKQARLYVENVVDQIQINYSQYFNGLDFNEKVVMADVIYNCHPANISYIYKQMIIKDEKFRKQELRYALSTLAYADGVRYGGLIKRFKARLLILNI